MFKTLFLNKNNAQKLLFKIYSNKLTIIKSFSKKCLIMNYLINTVEGFQKSWARFDNEYLGNYQGHKNACGKFRKLVISIFT